MNESTSKKCPNCGFQNGISSKFCMSCGTSLEVVTTEPVQTNITVQSVEQQPAQQEQVQPVTVQQPVTQQMQIEQPITSNVAVNNSPLNYLMYIIMVLLKPFKCFKEEESKLANTKTALIFSGIIAVIMMGIDLLKAMISAVFVKSMNYDTFQIESKFDISGLKNLDYLNLIGKNLLIYAGIIAAIALIYYLAGLVIKKNVNFIKLLSITATSIIPYIVLGMIASPILGKIWAPLTMVALIVGAIYSIVIFLTLINEEIKFDNNDMRIYFHLICLSILVIAGYYLFMNMLTSSITSDYDDLLNMFNY